MSFDWNSISEQEFDSLLENSLPEFLPENIVNEIAPWRKAINYILLGMAFSMITFGFMGLNYILPAIGMILCLLGFRMLSQENKWFRYCYIFTICRTIYIYINLILNTTIFHKEIFDMMLWKVLTTINVLLQFAVLCFLWKGFHDIKNKSEIEISTRSASALIIWYVILCGFAWIQYKGLIVVLIMIISYICILWNLYQLAKELELAGYIMKPAELKTSNCYLGTGIITILIVGCIVGYCFGGSYPMEWKILSAEHQNNVEKTKENLVQMGFPQEILEDLTQEEIETCKNATKIITDKQKYPLSASGSELQITGVAVKLSDENEKWKIFHYFQWKDTKFYGTDSIQLWPAYETNTDVWTGDGTVSGRILYDDEKERYVSKYYFLGKKQFTSMDLMGGEIENNNIFVSFSFPKKGTNQRGYISYEIEQLEEGWMIVSWINYTHQKNWVQYPAITAMENQMSTRWDGDQTFQLMQNALKVEVP